MTKEDIRLKIEKLKQKILSEPCDTKQIEEYMYLCSLERMPIELNKEVQQIYDCRFGFVNNKGKQIFIKFARSGGTGVSTSHKVSIIEEYEKIGEIYISIGADEKLEGLCEYWGQTKDYVDVVKSIVKNYMFKGTDKGWCKNE